MPCRRCKGEGEVFWPRCPSALLDVETLTVLEHFFEYEEHGSWPNGGAMLEQPVRLVRLFSIIRSEKGRIIREAMKAARGAQG